MPDEAKPDKEEERQQDEKVKDADNHRRMIEIAKKFGYGFPDKKPEDITAAELRYLWEAIHQIKKKYGISIDENKLEQKGYLEQLLDAEEKIKTPERVEPTREERREARRTATEYELGRRRRLESYGRRRRY